MVVVVTAQSFGRAMTTRLSAKSCTIPMQQIHYEARAYSALKGLIPAVTLYGFYDVWGILIFLALEHVGNAISEDEQITRMLRIKMKAALCCIHKLDLSTAISCVVTFVSMTFFLVDLEICQSYENRSEL